MDSLDSFHLLSTAPLLETDGGNWLIFRRKFKTYMDSVGLDEHFTKDSTPAESYEAIEEKPTKKTNETDDDHRKRMIVWENGEAKWKEGTRMWKKEDARARATLGMVLPNSIYMEISEVKTFYEMWETVKTHIEQITMHQKSNLKSRLNQMYCNEKDDVVTHLQEMESIYQQLASRDAKISDEDYVDAIICSLPQSNSNLMASLLMIHDQMNAPVTPAAIKNAVRKEHEARLRAATSRGRRPNERPNEIALHADTRGRGRGRGISRGRGGDRGGDRGGEERGQPRFTCFNCGGKGHKAANCPSPKKPRGDRRDSGRGNGEGRAQETAAGTDEECDEAQTAMVLGTSAIVGNIGLSGKAGFADEIRH
jgi:hypothetical protein